MKITLDELLENPERQGFVKIYCDKCGTDNYYDPEYAKTVTQCFGCSPTAPPGSPPPPAAPQGGEDG